MKSTTKQSHWFLKILSLVFLLAGLTACSSSEGGGGSDPLPDIPVSDGDWQTVPSTGGTIEKDSISITFPSGTFMNDSKVAITAVKKGLIGSDYEASPFYKIVMPATTGRTITIRMKSNEIGDDIHFVMRERGASMSYDQAVTIDSYLNASYSNGEYVATLPPIENGSEIDVDIELIMGVSHIPQDAPSTRGTTMTSGEVGDVKWEITYPLATIINLGLFKSSTHAKVESFKPVLNQYVKEAITKITDLGFKTNGKRKIPIYIESLKDRWGQHNQSTISDANSSISISYEEMSKAVPDTAGLRSTIIHELFHYFQSEYDPRPALIKGRSSLSPLAPAGAWWDKLDPEELVSEATVMYEMGAVWIEHLVNNGQLNASFQKNEAQGEESIRNDQVGFIDILKSYPDKTTKKEKYQTHGYAMAPLLYYITAKLDPYKTYGIDNSFVLELHQLWKSKFTKFKFSSTTYDCLSSLVGAKGCSFFYSNEEFEDYVLQLLNGKLIEGFRIDKSTMINDPKTLKQDEGSFTFDGVIAPFGFSARAVSLQGLEGKDLSKKKVVIKQKTEGMKTFLLMTGLDSGFAKFTKADKTATTSDSIVIEGSRLEKMRQENGKFLNDFFLITIRTDCTPSSRDIKNYTATFELKDEDNKEETSVAQFPGNVYRVSVTVCPYWKEESLDEDGKVYRTEEKSGIFDINADTTHPDPNVTPSGKLNFTYSQSSIHVEGEFETATAWARHDTFSFDIVGIKNGFENSKVQNLTMTLHSLTDIPWEHTANANNIPYNPKPPQTGMIQYYGTVSDGVELGNVTKYIGKSYRYTFIENPDNNITVSIYYKRR